jgi:manganese transport protein
MYTPTIGRASLTERTIIAGREVFLGRRRGPLAILPFAGPAVIASIAYMDPGNFATNIEAGAKHGYELLWVALSANLIAMLVQALRRQIHCGVRNPLRAERVSTVAKKAL